MSETLRILIRKNECPFHAIVPAGAAVHEANRLEGYARFSGYELLCDRCRDPLRVGHECSYLTGPNNVMREAYEYCLERQEKERDANANERQKVQETAAATETMEGIAPEQKALEGGLGVRRTAGEKTDDVGEVQEINP